MIEIFNVTNIRKSKIPCTSYYLSNKDEKEFDKTTYKSTVRSLIYLTRCTKFEITFTIGKVARCTEHPTLADWKKVMNIL